MTLRAGVEKINLDIVFNNLKNAGVELQSGLTKDEICDIETYYNFKFPPDYELFLSTLLPVNKGFHNWREYKSEKLRQAINWPLEGIIFDVENNMFWQPEWGDRPDTEGLRKEIAIANLKKFPKLIPICSHRFIPESPYEAGNPIISIYQTDIIYYGSDLLNYLENEFTYYFRGPNLGVNVDYSKIKRIEKWFDFIEENS